ncbi:hypothetical protein NST44_10385 [Paenibacillus sp. FSL W8-0919]|uniref:hypothetical protein n=1 Tax=Paenibacillus sp. FSL W8-0919 TaxID=2954707 RepID=UPI0030F7D3E7
MASNTPNLGLLKKDPMTDGNETFNIETMLNENWDKIDEAVGSCEAEITNLKQSGVDGKIRLETAIIAKEGTVSKQGQIATFEELDDGIRSIPTGTDTSDATAVAGDILASKTAYGPNGKITGTIPNLTGIRTATGTAKWPDGALAVYPEKGYQKGGAGDGEIKVTTAQLQEAEVALRSENIKNGANIFGVDGKSAVVDTTDALLNPQYLLVGQSGYDDGVKKNGLMPNRSAENQHMPGLEQTLWPGDRYFIRPPHGYYDGNTWVAATEPDLKPENIRAGVRVGGPGGPVGTFSPGSRKMVTNYLPEKEIPDPNTWLIMDLFVIPPSSNYVDVFTTKNNTIDKIESFTMTDDSSTIKTAALVLIDEAGVMYTLVTSTSGGADIRQNLTGFYIARKDRAGSMYSRPFVGDTEPNVTPMPAFPANFNLLGQLRFCSAHMYSGNDMRPIARAYARDLVVVTT